jgi:HEPN domain-containing protein
MKPHIEEALLSLRLADRDIKAFEVLSKDPEVHLSVACFHAQQAVEKSLKAVLFAYEIEFGRTHDLIKLTQLLRSRGVTIPVSDSQLRKLNPFAVTFRYDESDIETIPQEEAANLVSCTQRWAEMMVQAARKREEQDTVNHD